MTSARSTLLRLIVAAVALVVPASARGDIRFLNRTDNYAENAAGLWSALAANDVEAARAAFLDSHGGSDDPAVHAWIEDGRRAALELTAKARNRAGAEFALRRYIAGFRNVHVGLQPIGQADAFEPGFIAGAGSDGLRWTVLSSTNAAVPKGAEITACDGRAPSVIYHQDVLPYFGVAGVESYDRLFSTYVFADFGNPFTTRPARCDIVVGKDTASVALTWTRIAATTLHNRLSWAVQGARASFGIDEWRPGYFWIGLPSFATVGVDGAPADLAEDLLLTIARASEKADALRRAKAVVFDVRGNLGGAPINARKVLQAIWGDGFTENLALSQTRFIEMRASEGNIRAGKRGLADDAFLTSLNDMTSTLARLGLYPRRTITVPVWHNTDFPSHPTVTPRVILLSNGTCVSACLFFADDVLSIAGAELWGFPTGADTVDSDVRAEDLPSGLFTVLLPMARWDGRVRADNVAYEPAARAEAPFGSRGAAMRWVSARLGLPVSKRDARFDDDD